MRKSLYIIMAMVLLIFGTNQVNGQTGGYIIKIEVRGINLPPGCQSNVSVECGEELIENLYLAYHFKVNETGFFMVPKDADLKITMETFSQFITPELGEQEYLFEVFEWGTTFTLRVRLKVYDFPNITKVMFDNYFTIISDPALNLPPESTLTLNYRISTMDWQQSTAISNVSCQTISYSYLFGTLDSCDNTFEFQISLRMDGSGEEFFGATYSELFSPLLGPLSINNISRKACSPYLTINATVDPSIAAEPDRYNFYLLDNSSIPYILDSISFEGNALTLCVTNATEDSFISGGDYFLHVEDSYSYFCSRELFVSIGAPVAPLIITSAVSVPKINVGGVDYHITKYGMTNGEAIATLASTDNLHSLDIMQSNWSEFQDYGYTASGSNLTLSGLAAGTSTIRCVDNDGCYSNEISFSLTQPDPFSITDKTTVDAPCHPDNSSAVVNNGSLSFTINGGIPSYNVTVPGIHSSTDRYGNITITDLIPNNYTVIVNNGIEESVFNMAIGTPPLAMTIEESDTDINCKGEKNGTIVITVGNNANPLSNFEFNQESAVEESLAPNIKRYSSLGAGLYGVIVTDTEGCTAEIDNIEISEPENPLSLVASGSKIKKYGDKSGVLEFEIKGGTPGYNYSVYNDGSLITTGTSTGTTTIDKLFAGEYEIVVSDTKGCISKIENIVIIQPDAPLELSIVQINHINCNGYSTGNVSVQASGGWSGYRYCFNRGDYNYSGVFGGLAATVGTDSVFVIDTEGVTVGIPVIISEPDKIRVDSVTVHGLKCFNDKSGAIKLYISGGTPEFKISGDGFNWIDGDSLGNLDSGEGLTFFISDANGCESVQIISIPEPKEIVIDQDVKISNAHCGLNDGSIELSPYGGVTPYNFDWVDNITSLSLGINSNIAPNLKAGSYSLHLTDKNGCSSTFSTNLIESDGPQIVLNSIKEVTCFGENNGEIHVKVDDGTPYYEYSFFKMDGTPGGVNIKTDQTDGTLFIDQLSAGNYWLTVKDINNCTANNNFEINEPQELKVTGEVLDPACHNSFDGFIALTVTGGNGGDSYLWSDNSTLKNLQFKNKGDYSVRVTDSLGCNALTSFTLIAPPPPEVKLQKSDLTICAGNSIAIDGGLHSAYIWNFNNQVVSTDRFMFVQNMGYYVLEGFDEKGCSNKDSVFVMVSDTPLASFFLLRDSAIFGEVVEAIDVTWPVPDSIEWHFDTPVVEVGSTYWSDQFTIENPGTINVTLRAWYNGCYSDSTKSVVFVSEMDKKTGDNGEEPLILGFTAYPNPTDGNFRLALELERKSVLLITLYNSMGTVVDSRKMEVDGSFELPYSLDGLTPGVYLLVVRGGYEQRQVRIVIR